MERLRCRGIPESSYTCTLDRRRADPENDVGAGDEEGGSSIPTSLPDPAHLCIHDAIDWRASDVGREADGTHRLDYDCTSIWPVDASSGHRCWQQSREHLEYRHKNHFRRSWPP